MSVVKFCDRAVRRACCEPLEPRRLLNAGDLDLSFSGDGKATLTIPEGELEATDAAVQQDGKVVVVGALPAGNFYESRVYVARFDVNGNLDPSFGPAGTGVTFTTFSPLYFDQSQSSAVAIQPDQKIVVVGSIWDGSNRTMFVVRFTPDGGLDGSFSGDGWDTNESIDGNDDDTSASDVAIQHDGKIVIAGWSRESLADNDMSVVRYNSNGSLDDSFDFNGERNIGFGEDELGLAMTIDYWGSEASNPNYGKIIVVGQQTSPSDPWPEFAFARLNSNGSPDSSFDGDGKLTLPFRPEYLWSSARGVLVQEGGKIVVAGTVGFEFTPTHNFGLMRLNSNGTPDFTFGQEVGKTEIDFGAYDFVSDLIVGQTGRLIVGGGSADKMAMVCLTAEGTLDTVFSGTGKQTVSFGSSSARASALALAPGGTIVAAGGKKFATARLFDRKAVTVAIGSFQPNGAESGPAATGFTVARAQPLPTPQRVYINIGGTARPPYLISADYTASSNFSINHPIQGPSYVDIPANQGFVTVTITPINDSLIENDETAVFSIAADPVYDLGTPPSTTLAIRDDDTLGPPFVTASQFAYDEGLPQRVRFTFNRDVTSSIDAGDFSISGPSGTVPFSLSHDHITNTTTLSLNGILPDGDYVARANGAGIVSTLGTPMDADAVLSFFFLGGDANHDRKVDITDLGVLASNWQQSPRTFSQGDFDYNGEVDVSDLGILASHWQQSLLSRATRVAGKTRSLSHVIDGLV